MEHQPERRSFLRWAIHGLGAVVGAALGAIAGALGVGPTPRYDVRQVQPGQVGHNDTLGLIQTQPLSITTGVSSRGFARHQGNQVNAALNEILDKVGKGIIDNFRSASPTLQKALVDPLNVAFQNLAQSIEQGAHFRGDDIQRQMETYFGTTVPKIVDIIFSPLQKAVQKLDPVIKAFDTIIQTLTKDIADLEKQRVALHEQLQQGITALTRAQFTPAQEFEAAKQDLAALRKAFAEGTPQQRVLLAPRLSELAQRVFALGRSTDVLGFDPRTRDALQQQLNTELDKPTPNQTIVARLRASLAAETQQESDSAQQLAALRRELTDVLAGVQGDTDAAFTTLEGALQDQIALAQQQVALLAASVQDLASVDTTVQNALAVLNQMNATLGGPLNTSTQDALTQAQTIIQAQQLAVLQSIDSKLGGGVPALQSGTSYVPHNTLAFLHQGERVSPAHENRDGGRPIVIHVHGAGDPSRIAQEVTRHIERESLFRTTTVQTGGQRRY